MANATLGLMNPELMRQALEAEQQKNLMTQANMDPAAYLRYSSGLRGQQTGQEVGSLFGIEDPRLKQARNAQEAYNEALEISKGDATTSDFFKAFANAAAKRNLPDLALQASDQVQKITKSEKDQTKDAKKQAEEIILRVNQIPEELRTEEDNRKLAAANQLLTKTKDVTVQSSKILEDGTIIMALSNNDTIVRSPEGKELKGPEAAAAVKEAQTYSTEIFGQRQAAGAGGRLGQEAQFRPGIAGAVKGAEVAQDIVRDTFKQAGLVRSNIDNLQRALNLVEKEGATTGVIAERFPDWKESTIALRNMQNQLGLDIVGSVTFGALSEGELRLALSTALPTNLEPPALSKWIKDKISAQEKLLTYLTEQARFLSRPGRNAGDWLDEVERKGREQPADSLDAKRLRLEELRRKAAGGQ
jgi:hypothetical protein